MGNIPLYKYSAGKFNSYIMQDLLGIIIYKARLCTLLFKATFIHSQPLDGYQCTGGGDIGCVDLRHLSPIK